MVERMEELLYIILTILLILPVIATTILVGIYYTVMEISGVYDAERQIKKYN